MNLFRSVLRSLSSEAIIEHFHGVNFAKVADFIPSKAHLILFCEIPRNAFDILCSVAVEALAHHHDSFFGSWSFVNVKSVVGIVRYAFLAFVYGALEFALHFYRSFHFAQESDVHEFSIVKFWLVKVAVDFGNHVFENDVVLL